MSTLILALLVLVVYPSLYNFEYYTWGSCGWFIVSGVFNYGVQTFKSLAYKYDHASFIAPFQYFGILFLFLSDLLIFSYSFNITDIIGGFIIIL